MGTFNGLSKIADILLSNNIQDQLCCSNSYPLIENKNGIFKIVPYAIFYSFDSRSPNEIDPNLERKFINHKGTKVLIERDLNEIDEIFWYYLNNKLIQHTVDEHFPVLDVGVRNGERGYSRIKLQDRTKKRQSEIIWKYIVLNIREILRASYLKEGYGYLPFYFKIDDHVNRIMIKFKSGDGRFIRIKPINPSIYEENGRLIFLDHCDWMKNNEMIELSYCGYSGQLYSDDEHLSDYDSDMDTPERSTFSIEYDCHNILHAILNSEFELNLDSSTFQLHLRQLMMDCIRILPNDVCSIIMKFID